MDLTGANRIYQGATYSQPINLLLSASPANLSAFGSTPPRCQFRLTVSSAAIVLTPTMTWVNASLGQMLMSIPAATTTALGILANAIDGVYHVEIDNGTETQRAVEGAFQISPECTR